MADEVAASCSEDKREEVRGKVGEVVRGATKKLELDHNQLAALPESFGGLAALTTLDLSANQLAARSDRARRGTRLVSSRVCMHRGCARNGGECEKVGWWFG